VVRNVRVVEGGEPQLAAELVARVDENVHAVDADNAHEDDAKGPEDYARVLEGVRHRLHTGADVALQEVDHGLEIPGGTNQLNKNSQFCSSFWKIKTAQNIFE
jgi:hypothetical protein